MRSALDIALERYGGEDEGVELTDDQKQQLRDVQAKYDAKIAERQIVLDQEIQAASFGGKEEEAQQLRDTKAKEIASFRRRMEREKDKVRKASGQPAAA